MPPHQQRDDYLRDCAARFARDLETMVQRDPLQWYNFFPFWDQPESRTNRSPNSLFRANPEGGPAFADKMIRAPLQPDAIPSQD